jgi:hypothetical protein
VQLLNLGSIRRHRFRLLRAIDYQRQWNEAVVVQGNVVKPIRRRLSHFLMNTISFQDQAGQPQVTLSAPDVYSSPHVETVELRYLPTSGNRWAPPAIATRPSTTSFPSASESWLSIASSK